MSEPAAPALSESSVSDVAQLPPSRPGQAHPWVDAVFRFFCSLKLTLVNLLLLFFALIAGTFVNPANDSLANIEKAFAQRPLLLSGYRVFELYDLFHSWWFTLLLVSLALNLIACSIERLPRIYYLVKFPEKRFDKVTGLRFKAGPQPGALSPAQVASVLAARGYRVEQIAHEGGTDLFAEKGRHSRFGVWVVHISLLLILGGGVFGRLTAFEGTVEVPQGGGQADAFFERRPDGSEFRHKLRDGAGRTFAVVCDDFRLKEFEPGRPKSFESDLRVVEERPDGKPGRELVPKTTVMVNHPLKYAGFTFYQASYKALDERAHIQILDKQTGQRRELRTAAGEPIALEGAQYQVLDYNADFAGLGPAVQVVKPHDAPEGAPQASETFWVFAKAPDFDRDNREDRYAFSFDKLAPTYATGLQIGHDPSTPFIYFGCFLLFAGLGIAFYTAHKRLWLRLSPAGELALGGAAHRNAESFALEFDALRGELFGDAT